MFANAQSALDNENFKAISAKRNGLAQAEILSAQSPFIKTKIDDANKQNIEILTQNSSTPKLNSIIANRAKINGKWLKIGEEIDGYKLVMVDQNFATLEYQNTKITLTTKDSDVVIKVK